MTIGIDISQAVYEGTGVGRYVFELTAALLKKDIHNTYILFGSSWGQRKKLEGIASELRGNRTNVSVKIFPYPPRILDIVWNILHIIPIQWLIGNVDVFWSSDWTQPPVGKAFGITTIHDVSFLRYPESFDRKIITVHNRRLRRVQKECGKIFADSLATKDDIIARLHIPKEKITVVYPGFTT